MALKEGHSFIIYFSPYCCGRKKVYSMGLPLGSVTLQGRTAGCVLFLQLVDGGHKLALLFLGQLIGGQMFAVKGTPCSFAADHRANTGHGLVEGICHRQIPLSSCRHDGRTAHQQEVRSCRFGRRGVGAGPAAAGAHRCPQKSTRLSASMILPFCTRTRLE